MFVWEEGDWRIRLVDCEERERLAGLPAGWTSGFSRESRAILTGNAVIPAMSHWIAERIARAG